MFNQVISLAKFIIINLICHNLAKYSQIHPSLA
jgi:hypothetical protein